MVFLVFWLGTNSCFGCDVTSIVSDGDIYTLNAFLDLLADYIIPLRAISHYPPAFCSPRRPAAGFKFTASPGFTGVRPRRVPCRHPICRVGKNNRRPPRLQSEPQLQVEPRQVYPPNQTPKRQGEYLSRPG